MRWDGGYEEGDTISQYYDNLVGKLIVWAPDRDRAIDRMVRALAEFEIAGIKTTIPAHLALLQTDDFRAVDALDEVGRRRSRPVDVRRARRDAAHSTAGPPPTTRAALVERTVPVEVDGRRFRGEGVAARGTGARRRRRGGRGPEPAQARGDGGSGGAGGSGTVTAPMQGTIVKVLVEVGRDRRRSARRSSCSRR